MKPKKRQYIFQLDTDDEEKVDEFIKKVEANLKKGNNIYIPEGVRMIDAETGEVIQDNIRKRWWEFWK